MDFEIRNVAEDDPDRLLAGIVKDAAEIVGAERVRFPQARIDVEVVNSYPGLATPEAAEVVAFLRSLTRDPSTCKVAFGTEGGLFSDRLGVPTVVCGPGSMAQGHKPDEFVTLDQLAECDRLMDRLLDQLVA